jgi:hypothetical protein
MQTLLSQTDLEKVYRKAKRPKDRTALPRTDPQGRPSKRSIFLSHSHLDKTIIDKMILLFKNLETPLYIDWMDKEMPAQTDKVTAIQIKTQIQRSHKFLFLATYNALRSKWCNWELGLVFASKTENDYAVLPIATRSGNWPGNEYLQLYPRLEIDIQMFEQLQTDNIYIHMTDGRKISFKQWMAH